MPKRTIAIPSHAELHILVHPPFFPTAPHPTHTTNLATLFWSAHQAVTTAQRQPAAPRVKKSTVPRAITIGDRNQKKKQAQPDFLLVMP